MSLQNEKTLLSRQSLAKRWDFTSSKVIEKYESLGILTRVSGLQTPRYHIDEILKIESLGNTNPLSPIERRKLEKRAERLEKENEKLRNLLREYQSITTKSLNLIV